MRKVLRWGAAVLVTFYAVWCVLVVREYPNQTYPRVATPFEDARFAEGQIAASDGTLTPVALYRIEGAPVVLYFMGNAGSRALAGADLDLLLEQPVSVAVMAYRGGEGDPRLPTEGALKSDAWALYEQLPDLLGYVPPQVHVMGYSMGSGLALDLAARGEVSSVILQAPMPRICAMVGRMTWTPACLLPVDRWDNYALAGQVDEPVLHLYGAADTLFPPAVQHNLAQRFAQPPEGYALDGIGHNDIAGAADAEIASWLARDWPVLSPQGH